MSCDNIVDHIQVIDWDITLGGLKLRIKLDEYFFQFFNCPKWISEMSQRGFSVLWWVSLEIDVTQLVRDDDKIIEHTTQLKI